jgi:hypothetical protein
MNTGAVLETVSLELLASFFYYIRKIMHTAMNSVQAWAVELPYVVKMAARAQGHEISEIMAWVLRALESGCLLEEHIFWHIFALDFSWLYC